MATLSITELPFNTFIGIERASGASELLRLPASERYHFGQLLDSDGTVLLCLHQWAIEDHPSLMTPENGTSGNGLLLFFRVDDYGRALRRARALVSRLEEEPHLNPNTGTPEFSLRDPDGYYVTISAFSGVEQRRGPRGGPKKRLQPKGRAPRPKVARGTTAPSQLKR